MMFWASYKKYGLLVVTVAAGLFFGVFLNFFENHNQNSESEELEIKKILRIVEDDHVYGNTDAKIIIFEYSEVECIYCKGLHPILHRIVNESQGGVALVYRHFPLEIHPKSFTEALALECVAHLGDRPFFWNYLERLFQITPSNNNIDLSILPSLAREFGITEIDFIECLQSARYADRVQRDIDSGIALGVRSVPDLFIVHESGEILEFRSAPTYQALSQSIKALQSIDSQ